MKIAFFGDTNFSNAFNNPPKLDSKIIELIDTADFLIINLEGTCVCNAPKYAYYKGRTSALVSSESSLRFIRDLFLKTDNVVINMANNHIMDAGPNALIKMQDECNKYKFKYIGAGKTISEACQPIILSKDNVKIGIISIAHDEGAIATPDQAGVYSDSHAALIEDQIHKLKMCVDFVIIIYHGGEEFMFVPLPPKRRLLRHFIDIGADVVISHHAHVVQGCEQHGKGTIFYSLGNFIFDAVEDRNTEGTDQSLILTLDFLPSKCSLNYYFTQSNFALNNIDIIEKNEHFICITCNNYYKLLKKDSYRWLSMKLKNTVNYINFSGNLQFINILPKYLRKIIKLLFGTSKFLIKSTLDKRYRYSVFYAFYYILSKKD